MHLNSPVYKECWDERQDQCCAAKADWEVCWSTRSPSCGKKIFICTVHSNRNLLEEQCKQGIKARKSGVSKDPCGRTTKYYLRLEHFLQHAASCHFQGTCAQMFDRPWLANGVSTAKRNSRDLKRGFETLLSYAHAASRKKKSRLQPLSNRKYTI